VSVILALQRLRWEASLDNVPPENQQKKTFKNQYNCPYELFKVKLKKPQRTIGQNQTV
jgi:hypothetical protein